MKKRKIFGRDFEWYDVKTKLKKLLRGFFYLYLVRQVICCVISGYICLVYFSSRKKFVNIEVFADAVRRNKAVIISSWHNRLMMAPILFNYIKKRFNKGYKIMTLASNHGDGRFVGDVMTKFGIYNIFGSSNDGRKASRGIEIRAMRTLIRGLRSGKGLGITPDGPRGPNQKINGQVIEIARVSKALIVPVTYSCSRFIELRSWDRFKVPLPFSRIEFHCGEVFDCDGGDGEALEFEMNKVQDAADEAVLD